MPTSSSPAPPATSGAALVPELLAAGHTVRCLARTPAKLDDEPWRDRTSRWCGATSTDAESLAAAMEGVDAAYYLVHSMGGRLDFTERDRDAAAQLPRRRRRGRPRPHRVPRRARPRRRPDAVPPPAEPPRGRPGAGRGAGAGDRAAGRGHHRLGLGQLRDAALPRRGPAGDGHAALGATTGASRSPSATCSPTSSARSTSTRPTRDRSAGARGRRPRRPHLPRDDAHLRRGGRPAEAARSCPVPVLSPKLSSLWVGLVTPLPAGLARPLVESLVNEVVVGEHPASAVDRPRADAVPRRRVELALQRVADLEVTDQLVRRQPARPLARRPDADRPRLGRRQPAAATSSRRRPTRRPTRCSARVSGIGGDTGLVRHARCSGALRGWADKLVGGVGMRRGRRNPDVLGVGDAVDFWRVEAVEPDRRILLRAEMRLPGEAWLEWDIDPAERAGSRLTQRAIFYPRGLLGRAYWYALIPFHASDLQSSCRSGSADAQRFRDRSADPREEHDVLTAAAVPRDELPQGALVDEAGPAEHLLAGAVLDVGAGLDPGHRRAGRGASPTRAGRPGSRSPRRRQAGWTE